ncbi:MAG: adenine-specific methyltransferase EcoRI family protein [Candidatus Poribacteria bacterium]|nr:adenine-specific methyltransferase EcoRI family protein [Candidatus Poribacteria bacterium]
MPRNQSLHAANRAKYDEFYTQLSDIEKELEHYEEHFRGKTVYCNCDDPTISNFFLYFRLKFEFLGLKRLITTCYKNPKPDLFSKHDMETAVGLEYLGNGTEPTPFPLKEDGDFRSKESIELLEQADIVVTNPPFSLFRKYIAQLIEYDKKFVVIGSMNAIAYKEVFPLIKSGRLWLGHGPSGKDMLFDVPEDYRQELVRSKKEGSAYRRVDGVIKALLRTARWFTNLDHKKRHEDLILYKKYSPDEYPKYDNYDAINVSETADIPRDYAGEMGVPISFLDKHNPDQFEIIGMDRPLMTELTGKQSRFKINGKEIYVRIVIRNRRVQQ